MKNVANLLLEKVITKNRQFLDRLDEIVKYFLVAVDYVLHFLRSRDLTYIIIIIINIIINIIIIINIVSAVSCSSAIGLRRQ